MEEKRCSILVVDDEEAARDLLVDLLGENHRLLLASSAGEALDILRSGEDIDLLITDLAMPGQDGLELIRAIRKLSTRVKIIAISGAFDGHFLKAAKLLGASAILVKPFRVETLFQTVTEVLACPFPAS